MSKKGKASNHFQTFVRDLIFIGPFFVISFFSLRGTVPSPDPFWVSFWAGMVALSMTGVAWLALQMFKVVLVDQLELDKNRTSGK